MKLPVCLVAVVAILCSAAFAAPESPNVIAPYGILVEARTGTVLWAHNPDEQRPMASTTKIMTALLVLESGRLGDIVQVSPNAAKVAESSLNLKTGEHLTLDDLLHGIIMRSANDACVAAAEHLSGSTEAFVEVMNARAAQLGCKHTHYVNPNGLNAAGHYSSARDLAIITRAALKYPEFREIVSTPDYTIERDINKYDRGLKARDHWFLTHFPGADGVKTGYTRQAGHCFVGSATRNGMQLISVLMRSPNIKKETCTLLDWGFKNYRGGYAVKSGRVLGQAKVSGGSLSTVSIAAAEPAYVVIPRTAGHVSVELPSVRIGAPFKAGQKVGRARMVCDGLVVGHFDLITLGSVDVSPGRKAARTAAIGIGVLAGGVGIGATAKTYRRRRRRLAARRRGSDSRRARDREREGSLPR